MDYELRHVTYESPPAGREQVLRFSQGDYTAVTRSRLQAPWGNEIYVMVGAFAGECDTLRRRALECTGFRRVGTAHAHLRIGPQAYDLEVYERTC